jgi:RNA polymerase sigma-70 factor (ECF subfamily)
MQKPQYLTDQELMVALKRADHGAEGAFAELYGRYAQRTYAFILRMMGNSVVSQDLLQEVFIKFYTACRQELVVTNTGAFILMIARNLCLNHKRDEHSTDSLDELLLPSNEFSHSVEDKELVDLITLALDLLQYEYREAFVLKYYQGYSYEEISRLTGDGIPALKNRVWRAKEQIRSILKPYILENQQ